MNLARAFPWLASLFCFVSAVSTQEESIGLNATEIPALVEISGNLRFVPFVPQVENQANITISLAVPLSALSHLSSGNLTVYVVMRPKLPGSQLYFAHNPSAKACYLTLHCAVSEGSCKAGSVTSRTVSVYFNAPNETSLAGDEVIMRAVLSPFVAEQAVGAGEFFLDQNAYDKVVELEARVSNASAGQETSVVMVQSQTLAAQVSQGAAIVDPTTSTQLSSSVAMSSGVRNNTAAGVSVAMLNISGAQAAAESESGFHSVAASSGLSIFRVEPTMLNFIALIVVFLAALDLSRRIPLGRN